jgi:hypothetical protein
MINMYCGKLENNFKWFCIVYPCGKRVGSLIEVSIVIGDNQYRYPCGNSVGSLIEFSICFLILNGSVQQTVPSSLTFAWCWLWICPKSFCQRRQNMGRTDKRLLLPIFYLSLLFTISSPTTDQKPIVQDPSIPVVL